MKRLIASGGMFGVALLLMLTALGFRAPQAQMTGLTAAETPVPTPPATAAGITIFYSGERRATLEPCGCHTKQQGGLQLEATMYDHYKGAPQLRLDAGEWSSSAGNRMPTEPLKTAFLLRGLQMLDYDAINASAIDVQMTKLWFAELRKAHPEALDLVVSCNIFDKEHPEDLAFHGSKILERKLTNGTVAKIGITGAASLANVSFVSQFNEAGQPVAKPTEAPKEVRTESFIVREPTEPLGKMVSELRPKCDLLVVLYAGDFGSSIELAKKYPQIDVLIVTAHNNDPLSNYVREGNTTLLLNATMQAKDIRLVNMIRGAQGWQTDGPGAKLIISKDYAMDPKLTKLIDEYKEATKTIAAEMPPSNPPQIYASEDKCVNCHLMAHHQWEGTPHAHAMATLVERNQQFNPDCVRCHVTGYKHANGFWHITDLHSQVYMSNVQCEVCHGPSQQHVWDEQTSASGAQKWMQKPQFALLQQSLVANMPKKVTKNVCMDCHTQVTDPDFDFDKKIHMVDHTRPYKAETGPPKGAMHAMPAEKPAAPAKGHGAPPES